MRHIRPALTAIIATLASGVQAAPAGEAVYAQRCAMCHSLAAGQHRIGPSLAHLAGRKAATQLGYAYSPALKASGLRWSETKLDQFLANPRAVVPGTKMPIALDDPAQRRAVLRFLLARP